jgi:hypothetical protein
LIRLGKDACLIKFMFFLKRGHIYQLLLSRTRDNWLILIRFGEVIHSHALELLTELSEWAWVIVMINFRSEIFPSLLSCISFPLFWELLLTLIKVAIVVGVNILRVMHLIGVLLLMIIALLLHLMKVVQLVIISTTLSKIWHF